MAKTDKRKLGSPGGGKPGGKAPISSHPVFPAIVALWFAALFGIGSIVLPNVLIEKIVVATGLPTLVSAASPPLGFTAKLSMAIAASVFGALAGLFIARKVVAAQAQAPVRSRRDVGGHDDTLAKRPIVATEELGEEGLGPVADEDDWSDQSDHASRNPKMPGRRRALSVTDDSGPSEYLASVPLPGENDSFGSGEVANNDDDVLDMGSFETADPAGQADGSNMVAAVTTHAEEHAEAMDGLRNNAVAAVEESAPPPEPVMAGAVVGDRPFDVPAQFPHGAEKNSANDPFAAGNPAGVPFQHGVPSEDNIMTNEPASEGEAYNPFAQHSAEPPAEEAPRQVFGQPQPAAPAAAVEQEAAPAPLHFPPQGSPNFAAPVESRPAEATPAPFAAPAVAAPVAAPLADLPMSELIERFARSMQATSSADAAPATDAEVAEPAAAYAQPAPEHGAAPAMAQPQPVTQDAVAAPLPFTFQRNEGATPAPFAPAATEQNAAQETPAMPPLAGFPQHESPPHEQQPLAAQVPPAQEQPAPFPAAPAPSAATEEQAGVAAPAPSFAEPGTENTHDRPTVPAALRPLDLGAYEDDEDEDDPFAGGLGLDFGNASEPAPNPFAAPNAQGSQGPSPLDEAGDDSDTGNSEGYSSLLSMKSPLGANREFVRVEDEDETEEGRPPEPVVTFPGQSGSPAARPAEAMPRPFDAPPEGGQRTGGLAPAVPTNPAQKQADPVETERALREALEKLQRMSGAA